MSDKNIIVKIIGQSDMTAVTTDLQELQDRERDIRLEMLKQQAEYAKQVANISATVKGREAQVAALDKLSAAQKKQQASLVEEQAKMKSTLADFSTKMGNVNDTVAKGAVQAPKFTTQMRAMKQELIQMQMDGVAPTDKAFMDLSIRAGEMGNEIDDARGRVKVLASDTKHLDAAMGLGNGLAGGFTVATSAAALLGGENEKLQEAFFKVQAVMSIMSGVHAVAIALNKDEAFSVMLNNAAEKSSVITKIKGVAVTGTQAAATWLNTAAENGSKVAKVGSTIAQWALNSAMLANPVFWLIGGIGLLVGAYMLFSSSADESKKKQEAFNSSLQAMKNVSEQIGSDTDFYKRIAEARGKSEKEVLEIGRKGAKDALSDADKRYADLQKKYIAADADEKKKMKDGLKDAQDIQKNAQKDLKKINEDATVLDAKITFDSQKTVNEGKIALMKEGLSKEKAQIESDYKEKLKAYQGQSQEEKAARATLEAEKNKAIKEVNKKYRNQALNDKAEYDSISAKNEETQNRFNYDLKEKTLKEIAEAELTALRTAIAITPEQVRLKNAKILAVELKLKADLEAINNQKANDAAENLVLQDKNVEMAMKLQHGNDLKLLDDYNKQTLTDQASADKLKVEQFYGTGVLTVEAAQQKADKLRAIELKLGLEIDGINKAAALREIEATKTATDREISKKVSANKKILADFHSTGAEKVAAQNNLTQLAVDSITAETTANEDKYKAKAITKEVYEQKLFDIGEEKRAAELAAIEAKSEREKAIQQALFDMAGTLANGLFDMQKEALSQEMSDIDLKYTTDAAAAKKNHDLTLISDAEMAKKKGEIKRKQAVADKEQALFNIAIATAENIVKASNPLMAYMIPFIIASGVLQAALILAKPLPKYAKGRKGGRGEFATVGELGPETMWIPEGASIIPANRGINPGTMKEFGIPQLHVPELPNIDSRFIEHSFSNKIDIDYNRLGKAVADNVKIPKYEQKHVTVNVDKSGIIVKDGNQTTHYLNKKYRAEWN